MAEVKEKTRKTEAPFIEPGHTYGSITDKISSIILTRKTPLGWFIGFDERRFNFFLYADYETSSLKMRRNPDVTVRTRGIMEKCTYCVQRINTARIDAKKADRKISDGDVVTACQQVCPAEAIVFGDINDPESRVSKLKADHRNYSILAELGTRPRTSYLAKIKNPNPEIKEA